MHGDVDMAAGSSPGDSGGKRILVLGIGNILMKDEGVGCRVVEELQLHYEFPGNVSVVDSGTMGMVLLDLMRGHDFTLVVDGVDNTGYPPGTVVRMSPEDIAGNQIMHSLHDLRFIDVLEAARLIGLDIQGHVVGVQIEDMAPADLVIGLSESVEEALDTAIDAVLTVLAEQGVFPTPRTPGESPTTGESRTPG